MSITKVFISSSILRFILKCDSTIKEKNSQTSLKKISLVKEPPITSEEQPLPAPIKEPPVAPTDTHRPIYEL